MKQCLIQLFAFFGMHWSKTGINCMRGGMHPCYNLWQRFSILFITPALVLHPWLLLLSWKLSSAAFNILNIAVLIKYQINLWVHFKTINENLWPKHNFWKVDLHSHKSDIVAYRTLQRYKAIISICHGGNCGLKQCWHLWHKYLRACQAYLKWYSLEHA